MWAAFGQADYPEHKYHALGSTDLHILRFNVNEKLIEVELERSTQARAESIPEWAHKLIGGEHKMHHHTWWRRVSPTQVEAELNITPMDMPVSAHAAGTIIELGHGQTSMTLDFEVECRLPGLGATVARLFADQVKEALRADHAFTLRYLKGAASKPA